MEKKLLKDLERGDLFYKDFTKYPNHLGTLLVLDYYDRSSRRYVYHYYDNYNREGFLRGDREVYVP